MPGNELGDGVHNFFAQDNSLQGQHSQVVEGNWPVLNSNFWVGNQRQVNLLNSNKNFSSQQSDLNRAEGSYPLQLTHGLNFSQPNSRPEYAGSQSANEQPNSSGFMYGNQFQQASQNEANLLAMDTDPDQRHLMTSRGLSFQELQQGSGSENHQAKVTVRSVTSAPPVSFDLFGGQQQTGHHQSSMPQSLQRQQSGINDMQQLQQQLMIRNLQELQRKEQLRQLDPRQQNLVSQVPPFTNQTSASQPALVNGTPNADSSPHSWTSEIGTNWLNRGSPTMQVSPNGLVFPPNIGKTQRLDLVPQQVDQSLYGVPISSSRGLPVNQYSQVMTDRSSMPQMSKSNSISHRSIQNNFPNQIGLQDESSVSTQKFENENLFGLASRHSLNTEMRNIGTSQPVNSMPRNAPQQDFMGKQEAAVPPETSHDKPSRQAASPQNEVALDPTEAKILFGSDDNIWAAFSEVPHMSGDAGNSFDNSGLLNGVPSTQSGSWSALMQSAVAETSSSDVAPMEEWSGLTFHNNDNRPLANQYLSMHNDSGKQSTANDSMRTPSAPSSGSFPPSDSMSTNKAMGLSQIGHNFQDGPGQRPPTEMSQRFIQSMEEANKWSKSRSMNRSVAKGSQAYGNASQHPLEAERNAKSNFPTLAPGQAGSRIQQNGWNALAAIPPAGDIMQNSYEAERFSHNPQNNRVSMMQGELVHGSSLLKSNSIPSSAIESGDVKYVAGNPQANKGIFSVNDAASLANSGKAGPSDETSSFVQNNYALNQWNNAHPAVASHGGESLGRRLHQANESYQVLDSMNSRYEDENSNDSHLSNMSQHTSGGFREGGMSDATDSQSLQSGKQKSNNQLSRKVSAPRKFQYHPMGNVHEEVEPSNGPKQPIRVQAMSQQNAQFGQAKSFGHTPRNSTAMEKGHSSELQRDSKGPDEESSRGNFSSHEANLSNKASSTSQNMLELLHKVDQTNDYDAMMQHSSSEHNASSQRLEEEKNDGFGRLQRNQSSVPHGFGLQLGPPSQRLQIADHPLSSQNGPGTVGNLYSGRAAPGMEDKGQQTVSSPSHSLPSVEETQAEFKRNRSAMQGNGGNENSLYKMSGNFTLAPSSGAPHYRTHLQDRQMTRVSGEVSVTQHIDHFSGNAVYSTQGGSMGTFLPGASGSVRRDNLASSGVTSQQSGKSDIQERVPTSTIPTRDRDHTSQHFSMSGIARQGDSAQGLHYVWTNVPRHQHKSSTPFQQNISHIPEFTQPNIIESSSALAPQGFVNSQGVIDGEEQRLKASSDQSAASLNADLVPKMKESLGKASSMKNRLDDSPSNSASTQKDIEAFGRSLKPSSFPHQNYTLLNQIQGLKDAEIDSSNRVSKRIKVSDDSIDVHDAALKAGQQNDQSAVIGESMVSSTAVPSEDSRMLSFSWPDDILQRNTSEHGNAASKDTLGLGQDVPQSSSCSDYTTVKLDRPQFSPQMAPSWFNQYGTFRNGQILQVYDERRVTPLRPGEPPFPLGKSPIGSDVHNSEEKGTFSSVDAVQSGRHQNSTNSLLADGDLSSPHSSQMNVTGQRLVNLRPKKRKSSTSELHPWYKEISGGSQNLWTISMAESEWNRALNRLNEKVEDGAEIIEDGPSALRSKRRLILTTQLMQQLIRRAPSAILSADASLKYENVAYSVSRIALGDACGAASLSSDSDVTHDSMDLLVGKGKSSERNAGGCYAKSVEELIGRARKLENDFLRLDKSASVLELRIECQDLEKFSVINRFARFHGRGQSDNAETSTDVTTTAQKPIPQRYVTAVPVPRSFPDRVVPGDLLPFFWDPMHHT